MPFAVDEALYLIDGKTVLELEGSEWKRQGNAPEGAISLAEESSGGKPIAAFVNSSGRVQIDRFSGSSWSKLTEGAAPASGSIQSVQLLSDGSTPIVSWVSQQEDLHDSVYADELSGGSLVALSGGAELTDGDNVGAAATLALLAGVPYIGLGEARDGAGEEEIAYTRVLKLEGTSFVQVAGTVRETPFHYQLSPGLAEYEGAPVAVTIAEDPKLQVLASRLGGGAWTPFGGQLGVPPLPSPNGGPYELVTFEGAGGTPYVALAQQAGTEFAKANIFLEDYTPAGVDPLGDGMSSEVSTPSVTNGAVFSVEEPSPPPSKAPAASAALELMAPPSLAGKRKRKLELKTGVSAYCPAAGAACKGTVALKLAKPKGAGTAKVGFSVPAGATQAVEIALPKRAAKAIARAGAAKGSETVSATGPNSEAVSLSERVAAKLAHESKGKTRRRRR